MIFLFFSNTTNRDEERGFYTRNDAFNLILKSDFDFTQQKMKKLICKEKREESVLKAICYQNVTAWRSGVKPYRN